MILKVTDYQDRGTSGTVQRQVFINTSYIVAMEPWGSKYKVYVGRSLEYVVSPEDAEQLGQAGAREPESTARSMAPSS